MAFSTTNNYSVLAGTVNGNKTFSEKLDIPATRGAVQKTFNGLVNMIDSNFATKQMNSTTVYECDTASTQPIKSINMPKGFVLYDGVKFLVNIIQSNTTKESLSLRLVLKDSQYTSDIKINRIIDDNVVKGDKEEKTIKNNIQESVESGTSDQVLIQGAIYKDFVKTNSAIYDLSKGLYVVEYIKNRILISSENLKLSDLETTESEILSIYNKEKVSKVPNDAIEGLKIEEGFLIDDNNIIYEKSGKNPLLKKVQIKEGFNFLTPSSQVNTKTTIEKENLYFTFVDKQDLFSEVYKQSDGVILQNQTYKGTSKDLFNVNTQEHSQLLDSQSKSKFYYNAKKEKLYLPDTYCTSGIQIKTLNTFKLQFTEADTEGADIYSDSSITNPYAASQEIWKTSRSAYIDAYTFSGQSRAVMTQKINNVNRDFYFGNFSEAKDTSFSEKYRSQQRVYLNPTLTFNPGFTYSNTYNKTTKEGFRSHFNSKQGKLTLNGCFEGQVRLKNGSEYFKKDSLLKIDSEDDYGNIIASENRILKNDDLVMATNSTIYAEKLDVKSDLIIGKYGETSISNNLLGEVVATETLLIDEKDSENAYGLKFGRILNKNTNKLLNITKKDGDYGTDLDFSYALGIDGLNSRVHAVRIDKYDSPTYDSIMNRNKYKPKVDGAEQAENNKISLITVGTLYKATPKIAGTYNYNRNNRFWCPTSLPNTDIGLDELGNPNGDICTVTSKFSAGEGDTNDSGSVGWVSRAALLGGQSSFGWNNNIKIKVNSGYKGNFTTETTTESIISNIPQINSPGKLFNTIKSATDVPTELEGGKYTFSKIADGNDTTINFSEKNGDTYIAENAEIQVTLGDSGCTSGVYGQASTIVKESTAGAPSFPSVPSSSPTQTTYTNAVTAALGQTLTIPHFRVNSKGIVTQIENHSIYIPTAQEILGLLTKVRTTNLAITNSDGETLAILDTNGNLKITSDRKIQLKSIKVENLEVDNALLVPGKKASGTSTVSPWNNTINYATSNRAIYVN